jgi:hypothetical protein
MSKPPVSARDVSYHQAQAGAAAQQAAADAGGDPAAVGELIASASIRPEPAIIQGEPLHGYTLQVILCTQIATSALGRNPLDALPDFITRSMADPKAAPNADELLALGRIGFIFTRPAEAYELLADAAEAGDETLKARRVRDFDAAALEVAGGWTPGDIGILIRHLITVGKSDARGTERPT